MTQIEQELSFNEHVSKKFDWFRQAKNNFLGLGKQKTTLKSPVFWRLGTSEFYVP